MKACLNIGHDHGGRKTLPGNVSDADNERPSFSQIEHIVVVAGNCEGAEIRSPDVDAVDRGKLGRKEALLRFPGHAKLFLNSLVLRLLAMKTPRRLEMRRDQDRRTRKKQSSEKI